MQRGSRSTVPHSATPLSRPSTTRRSSRLKDLRARSSQQQLRQDFEHYLDGFSPNVLDILENFKFRNQIPTLSKADALGTLIEKFLDPEINFGPTPVLNGDGSVRQPAMDNHTMGTVFEELVRKFNEENNEEAGEHWTPRDAVRLMANLVFLPVADSIHSGAYKIYDGACGTGGMLTVAEETLQDLVSRHGRQASTYLYGQEINPETYAICKADMLLKGEGDRASHIVGGADHSTLSHDAFPAEEFAFMLSNPPYGKSWKKDLEAMGGKDGMRDPRFKITHGDDTEYSLVTRSSDGQMLFLANMASKMSHNTHLGSRIAEVHNGSSLFTGDAGQGESNIRRWLIENDWLDAIIALPLNMFYNTGIATYIWVLTNRKPASRAGQVQLIDATQWFKPLRKNLGKKNCELSDDDIKRICDTYLNFEETPQSKIFPNRAFGYWKVVVDRPLRLHSQITRKAIDSLRFCFGRRGDPGGALRSIWRRAFRGFRVGAIGPGETPERMGQVRRRTAARTRKRRKPRSPRYPKSGRRDSSTHPPGGATAAWWRSRTNYARNWEMACSRTTTCSATGWTRLSVA